MNTEANRWLVRAAIIKYRGVDGLIEICFVWRLEIQDEGVDRFSVS